MGFLLLCGLLGLFAGRRDSSEYSHPDDSCDNSDEDGRFTESWPYEYDNLTGYTRSDYCNDGYWTDCIGNRYEQKTDCYGVVYYERADDDE